LLLSAVALAKAEGTKKCRFLLLGTGKPHQIQVSESELKCSFATAQLGSDANITSDNRVVIGCYELMVVICNYQIAR